MRVALAFGLAVLAMLAVVITGDQLIGASPETPPMSEEDRLSHLQIVVAAVGIVVCVNAIFMWLTFQHPPEDDVAAQESCDD